MGNYYDKYFSKLINLITNNRDACVQFCEESNGALGALLSLGDGRYKSYSSMVETNEYRATKIIEALAVLLLQKQDESNFMLYPVEACYRNLSVDEQAKTRPFQIVFKKDRQRTGVVFSTLRDAGSYCEHFVEGDYSVEALKIVLLVNPRESAYDTLIASVNEFNAKRKIPLERVTLREFWEQHFGKDGYVVLVEYINRFNEQAKSVIGFSTVITPTEHALQRFREKTGEMLCSFPYKETIPDNIYQKQIDIFYNNYIEHGLWRAMIGKSNFAISFITSEWNFSMYQLSENLDLTSIVSGYLKSIEQLIWAIIELKKEKTFSIKSKLGGLVEFSMENEDVIDGTLWSLEQVIKHNSWMVEVNYHARNYMIQAIDDWREKHRNGYFHRDNLQSEAKVKEIRNQTLQLYFLILGGCKIKKEDFERLGIEQV